MKILYKTYANQKNNNTNMKTNQTNKETIQKTMLKKKQNHGKITRFSLLNKGL